MVEELPENFLIIYWIHNVPYLYFRAISKAALPVVWIMLAYAFLTEILQEEMHLGRSMETLDIIADTIGVFIGYFFFKKIKNLF